MRRTLPLLALALTLIGGCGPDPATDPSAPGGDALPRHSRVDSDLFDGWKTPAGTAPRSVIFLIGDGMGPQQIGLLMDWADAAGRDGTAWASLVDAGTLGMVRTGAQNSPVTDSAASATSMAAGVTAPNGFIGMDATGTELTTCLDDAQATGRRTGLVSTARLTHATPAAFAAHTPDRGQEELIAEHLLASNVDVMLGGGAHYLPPEALTAAGYSVVTSAGELSTLVPGMGRVAGVFSRSHIPYALDRDTEDVGDVPTLAEMSAKALEVLSAGDAPFFLRVEAGRIDHGGHINDVAAVLGEMREMDDALAILSDYAGEHPDTLLVVTADHETGGLALSYGSGRLSKDDFLAMARAETTLEAQAPPRDQREAVDPAVFGVGRAGFYPPYSHWETSRALERSALWHVSYGTQGHTATPVPIAARGPGAEHFGGLLDHVEVGRLLRHWMHLPPEPAR